MNCVDGCADNCVDCTENCTDKLVKSVLYVYNYTESYTENYTENLNQSHLKIIELMKEEPTITRENTDSHRKVSWKINNKKITVIKFVKLFQVFYSTLWGVL